MKRWRYLFIFFLAYFVSCKTDKINGNSVIEFQESVNAMSSSLKTIKQVKLKEALYVIKQFGIDNEEDNLVKMSTLAKVLHGKKLTEIFFLADSIASVHGLNWLSDAPPSMEDMDVFLGSDIPLDSIKVYDDELAPLNDFSTTLIYPNLDDPEVFVSRFLQNISEERLAEAYRMSNNPDWESFEIFSNPNSGFGSVKHINIENIVVESRETDRATINSEYTVIDNADRKIHLNTNFILSLYSSSWKVIHYKVNSIKRL